LTFSVVLLPCEMKLLAEPARFGLGKYAAIFTATGSRRDAGMRLPANGARTSVPFGPAAVEKGS
jgi:hypothetical protein